MVNGDGLDEVVVNLEMVVVMVKRDEDAVLESYIPALISLLFTFGLHDRTSTLTDNWCPFNSSTAAELE